MPHSVPKSYASRQLNSINLSKLVKLVSSIKQLQMLSLLLRTSVPADHVYELLAASHGAPSKCVNLSIECGCAGRLVQQRLHSADGHQPESSAWEPQVMFYPLADQFLVCLIWLLYYCPFAQLSTLTSHRNAAWSSDTRYPLMEFPELHMI